MLYRKTSKLAVLAAFLERWQGHDKGLLRIAYCPAAHKKYKVPLVLMAPAPVCADSVDGKFAARL